MASLVCLIESIDDIDEVVAFGHSFQLFCAALTR